MAKILVTGGAGYIGSHCAHNFIRHGHEVLILDNLSRGHAQFVKNIPFVEADIRDRKAIEEVFKNHSIDALAHFAALSFVGESVEKPLMYWDNNVSGSTVLFDVAVSSGLKNIVFSSTCAVYGEAEVLPITENEKTKPINPYGQTKLAVESILENLDRSKHVRSVSFRYFNAAGADYRLGLGELHNPETHLLPLAIEAALGVRPALKIFGSDFNTPDGSAIRDYIHVSDLARAHLLGIEYLLAGGTTEVLNLGTGYGTSIFELLQEIEAQLGCAVPNEVVGRRPGDPETLFANPAKAKQILNWCAEKSLKDIVHDALQWHKAMQARGLTAVNKN